MKADDERTFERKKSIKRGESISKEDSLTDLSKVQYVPGASLFHKKCALPKIGL